MSKISYKAKKKWLDSIVLVLLTFMLGFIGIHKLYQRKFKVAAIYAVTMGIVGLGWIYDIFANMFYGSSCFVYYVREIRHEAYIRKCKEQKLEERKNKKFRFIK